eukprot:GDKJ01010621.1.p2 GENE.GDKJ01010621.1~~GDKJ01010621.1.p2  ORF type:complete len:153 (+),score=25.88 GDKJ01010621.1:662-1120(+)
MIDSDLEARVLNALSKLKVHLTKRDCASDGSKCAVQVSRFQRFDKEGRGGLVGRKGKAQTDSCYTFWVCAALEIIHTQLKDGSVDWRDSFDLQALREFLKECSRGGQGRKHPEMERGDPFHSMMILLSGKLLENTKNEEIDWEAVMLKCYVI